MSIRTAFKHYLLHKEFPIRNNLKRLRIKAPPNNALFIKAAGCPKERSKNIQSSRHPGIQTNPPFHRRVQKANPRKQCLRPTKRMNVLQYSKVMKKITRIQKSKYSPDASRMPLFMALYMPESFQSTNKQFYPDCSQSSPYCHQCCHHL